MKRTAILLLVPALLLAACTTNPATGKKQFNFLAPDQEVAMGTEATPEITKEYGGKVNDPGIQAYLTEVGKKLAAGTEGDNPKLPWEFTMLDSDVINAFSLPGGKVFFSRGLAAKLKNEAQLAGVLGHEIGHVTARHINDQMVHQAEVGVAAELASSLLESKAGAAGQLVPQVVQFGGQTVLLQFSRPQETQADSLGLRYMTKAHYNPKEMLGVMQVLEEAMKGNTTPEFFSTHPYPDTRIKAIQGELKNTYSAAAADASSITNAAEYQKRMLQPLAKLPPAPKPAPAPAPQTGAKGMKQK